MPIYKRPLHSNVLETPLGSKDLSAVLMLAGKDRSAHRHIRGKQSVVRMVVSVFDNLCAVFGFCERVLGCVLLNGRSFSLCRSIPVPSRFIGAFISPVILLKSTSTTSVDLPRLNKVEFSKIVLLISKLVESCLVLLWNRSTLQIERRTVRPAATVRTKVNERKKRTDGKEQVKCKLVKNVSGRTARRQVGGEEKKDWKAGTTEPFMFFTSSIASPKLVEATVESEDGSGSSYVPLCGMR